MMVFAIKIIRPEFSRKLFILHLFYLLFGLIPTAAAAGPIVTDELISFPDYSPKGGLKCPTVEFSEQKAFGTFGSQIGTFIPIAFLLFTVAVYGTKSVFGYMRTCLIDDVVILTSSLVPILSWYFFGKPYWYKLFNWFTDEYNAIKLDKDNNTITGDDETVRINDINDIYIKDLHNIITITVVAFLAITFLMLIIGRAFYKRRDRPNDKFFQNMTNKDFFDRLKTVIIWIYLFHSITVMIYTCLETSYFYDQYDQYKSLALLENSTLYSETYDGGNYQKAGFLLNLEFIHFLINLFYLVTAIILVFKYHFPGSDRNHKRFVHKKIFFYLIPFSLIELFFEYSYFCTPPVVSTVFNSILTTILTRSIASFFSSSGIIQVKDIDKHYYKNYQHAVFAKMEAKNIKHLDHFYKSDFDDKDDTLKQRDLVRYKVNSVDGYVYAREETDSGKSVDNPVYYYVITDGESVYFQRLVTKKEDGNIDNWSWESIRIFFCFWKNIKEEHVKKQIKAGIQRFINDKEVDEKCVNHYCESVKQEEDRIVIDTDNLLNEMKKKEAITEMDELISNNEIVVEMCEFLKKNKTVDANAKKEEEDNVIPKRENDGKVDKTKNWKIEGYVLINVLQTGFLNYLVYSHRTSKRGNIIKPTSKEDDIIV